MNLKEMTLSEYQTAAAGTALDTAYSFEYLIPGILSEVGEVYGKLAKSHRDRWHLTKPPRTLSTELVKEFGDICWGTAILLKWLGVEQIDPKHTDIAECILSYSTTSTRLGSFHPVLHRAVQLENNFHLFSTNHILHNNSTGIVDSASILWEVLRLTAPAVTDESFDYVLGVNIAKLQSRQARNVLEGDGDDR